MSRTLNLSPLLLVLGLFLIPHFASAEVASPLQSWFSDVYTGPVQSWYDGRCQTIFATGSNTPEFSWYIDGVLNSGGSGIASNLPNICDPNTGIFLTSNSLIPPTGTHTIDYVMGWGFTPSLVASSSATVSYEFTSVGGNPVFPPDPPTTQFNEVLDYIYEPDLHNTFGTSTIGANFSIAQFDWINYVGVTLTDPLGQVVWMGTTTPTENGLYSISSTTDFNISGVYKLEAFFNQTISGVAKNVPNPVSLLITINAPAWVFDPVTGDLVPQASTTVATSTLLAFHVDCPDSVLVGSLCKLAVAFFIPSAASIQGVQASFSSLMSKAPFSFFTQSGTILQSFRTGSSATGGTFSLTLYGTTTPIVSSSTAAAVGLGGSEIDILKSIMRVGLWLLLAWYLYWRIASIFGV